MCLCRINQSKPTESLQLKGDKELKPVSMRVRDAAEALLTAVIDYVVCTHYSVFESENSMNKDERVKGYVEIINFYYLYTVVQKTTPLLNFQITLTNIDQY